jgi:hypothetical protein
MVIASSPLTTRLPSGISAAVAVALIGAVIFFLGSSNPVTPASREEQYWDMSGS